MYPNPEADRLLDQLKERLREQAQPGNPSRGRFNMQYWGQKITGCSEVLAVPVCRTQACLAGELILMTDPSRLLKDGGISMPELFLSIAKEAAHVLGLSSEQESRLFIPAFDRPNRISWLPEDQLAYDEAKTPEERAEVAIRRITRFQESGGRL